MLPNTDDSLLLTERMEAMADMAIRETTSVYSTAVAPWLFLMRRRKMESICKPTTGGINSLES
jgi:hypothetical protein